MEQIKPITSSCDYCGTEHSGSSSFCCSACELLYQIDFKSWSPSSDSLKIKKLEYMDEPEFHRFYSPDNSFSFYVDGLHCASCIHLLEKIPEFYNGVASVSVNYTLSLLKVKTTPEFKMSEFIILIEDLGYSAWPVSKSENLEDKYKLDNRKSLKRIALAGAAAGNIMLFSVPIYGGLTGPYAHVFNWIMFVLFLPIVTYCALPFYQGAWNSLRYKVINIDLPITVALWGGFILSTYNLLIGRSEVYFDSTASFIFLILSTRYLVKRIQQKSLSQTSLTRFLPLQSLEVKTSAGHLTKLSSELQLGDIVTIKTGQIIPADGVLYSALADLDTSLLNGESFPQTLSQGMKVYAGTKCVSKPFDMTVEQLDSNTEIGKIILHLETDSLQKTKFITTSESISQWLIIVVFALAIGFFFIFGALVDYTSALNRSLALIVIACPCALAFGTPLTYALSLRKAREKGILIKNGDVFEKLLSITHFFFDKTGTLTSGQMSLEQTFPCELDNETKSIVLGLESQSTHPFAFGFRKAWKGVPPFRLDQTEEVLGVGVKGVWNGDLYSLESSHSREESGLMSVKLRRNGNTLAYFYFSDEIHSDTASVIKALQKTGYAVGILSGDKKYLVNRVADQTQIPKALVFSELKPFDKVNILKDYKTSCMIGDGANDAMALQNARLGISVKGAVSLSHSSSEVYFTQPGLKSLLDFISISKQSQKVLKTNLAFALIYNSLGGALALLGLIDPLVAAILMPLSSLLIILNTYRGLK